MCFTFHREILSESILNLRLFIKSMFGMFLACLCAYSSHRSRIWWWRYTANTSTPRLECGCPQWGRGSVGWPCLCGLGLFDAPEESEWFSRDLPAACNTHHVALPKQWVSTALNPMRVTARCYFMSISLMSLLCLEMWFPMCHTFTSGMSRMFGWCGKRHRVHVWMVVHILVCTRTILYCYLSEHE